MFFFLTLRTSCSYIFECDQLYSIMFAIVYSIAGLQFIDNMRQYVVINCLCIRPPIKVIRFGKSSKLKIGFTLTPNSYTQIQTHAHAHTISSPDYFLFFLNTSNLLLLRFNRTLIELVSLLANIMRILSQVFPLLYQSMFTVHLARSLALAFALFSLIRFEFGCKKN